MKKMIPFVATVLALAVYASAQIVPAGPGSYWGLMTNAPVLSLNTTSYVDLAPYAGKMVSAQVLYSSDTLSSATFGDGQQSTGSFTVASNALVSSVSATSSIQVWDNSNLQGAVVRIDGVNLVNGLDWVSGDVSSNTAKSLATAIGGVLSGWTVAASSAVVYSSAPYGTAYNGHTFVSSTKHLVVSSATSLGGVDPVTVTINSVPLTCGVDFSKGSSAGATATLLAAAINANVTLKTQVKAGASGAVVTSTSIYNGTAYNYPMSSNKNTAISTSQVVMSGGKDPAWTLNGQSITIASHGFGFGTQLLYTGNTDTSKVIGGLSAQTTYYAVPIDASHIALATTAAYSIFGSTNNYVTFTSSRTPSASQTSFTIAPLAISGTPGLSWVVSNDTTNWQSLNVSSVTMSSYTNPYAVAGWDFGWLDMRYLGLVVTAPTTGAISVKNTVNIKQ